MSHRPSSRIHPTALISPEAELAPDVEVGPYVVIEGAVRIGPGCSIRPYGHLIGPLVMGARNQVFSGAVLGERPQHLKYDNEPTRVEIGDDNIFREHVTVHRGTTHSWKTVIGNKNLFMANSHVAHDCQIGNSCILANGALMGGHCVIEDNVYLSGNCALHQFVRVGRLALVGGLGASTMDVPPFVMVRYYNTVVGINVVGMRRAGLSASQIEAVRHAYHLLFREGLVLSNALAKVEKDLGAVDVVQELLAFVRSARRGITTMRPRGGDAVAA